MEYVNTDHETRGARLEMIEFDSKEEYGNKPNETLKQVSSKYLRKFEKEENKR